MNEYYHMYAVITGDIVDSTSTAQKQQYNPYAIIDQCLSSAFNLMVERNWMRQRDYVIFRGDSFQCILPAKHGLKAALLIKSALKGGIFIDRKELTDYSWSCRLVVGLGEVSYRADQVSKSNGPAFQRSGISLDNLPKEHYTAIVSPWDDTNKEFDLVSRFLDIIIERLWTINSARIAWVYYGEEGRITQREMAEMLHISQSAVHGRIHSAELPVIDQTLLRYQSIINSHII